MLSKKVKQNFRVIAVIEELDDVSQMLKEYFEEYGYKAGIVSKLEVNIPYEIAVLHVDPNRQPDLKKFSLESIVINLKNPLIYKNDVYKVVKKLTKTGSIVCEKKALEKMDKKLPKNILKAYIDYSSPEEGKNTDTYKFIGFYAESITKSLYKYTDEEKSCDKAWKINNKYAYKMEALLFATLNSNGLIS